MLKAPVQYRAIEHFDQIITMNNGQDFQVKWMAEVNPFTLCGDSIKEVECLNVQVSSVRLLQLDDDRMVRDWSLPMFNDAFKTEKVDVRCNCHGFTFGNARFMIDNRFVDDILEVEYEEVKEEESVLLFDYDVVCFKGQNGEWVHSAKQVDGLFIHKEGIREFSVAYSLEDIQNKKEYQNTKPFFFTRRRHYCTGICVNELGAKPSLN